jgi:hypothetical protein
MNNSTTLTSHTSSGNINCSIMLVTSLSQLPHWLHQLTTVGREPSENTNLRTKFLLQIQKQQEDSAMLLASNKQHKEITKKRKTQQNRQNTKKRTAGKNKDQVGLQEAPHFQDYTKSCKC